MTEVIEVARILQKLSPFLQGFSRAFDLFGEGSSAPLRKKRPPIERSLYRDWVVVGRDMRRAIQKEKHNLKNG